MEAKMAKKSATDDYEASLKKSFSQWDNLYKYGGQDPFWSDGCNLNLIRSHILNYKRLITETMTPERYPEIYYRQTPPEVDRNYMARASDIRINAKASLDCFKSNPDYQYLCRQANSLRPKDERLYNIRLPVNIVKGLEKAIADNDLVTMRRYENPERDLESFASAAHYLRDLPPENRQLSLFDYNDENTEDDELEW